MLPTLIFGGRCPIRDRCCSCGKPSMRPPGMYPDCAPAGHRFSIALGIGLSFATLVRPGQEIVVAFPVLMLVKWAREATRARGRGAEWRAMASFQREYVRVRDE